MDPMDYQFYETYKGYNVYRSSEQYLVETLNEVREIQYYSFPTRAKARNNIDKFARLSA